MSQIQPETPGAVPQAPAAGTEETPPVATPPPAEATTIPEREGVPPETIPYARFKEVNDQLAELRDYRQFSELGYDPDSLGRLVNLESSFAQDPLGTLGQIIDQIEEIPDGRKAALKDLIEVQPAPESPAVGDAQTDDSDEPPKWAKPLIEDYDTRRASEEQQANEAQLDSIVSHWRQLDEKAGITTREEDMLAYIMATASRADPDIQSLEQLAEAARDQRLAAREADLGGAVIRRGEGSPLAVPAGGAAATQPVEFRDIGKASKAALADIQAGRLGGAE